MELASGVYKPRDPRTTALYEVVRDTLETLYGAIEDGAIAVHIPKHARSALGAKTGAVTAVQRTSSDLRLNPDVPGDPETNLAASAVSGQTPPAGPQWVSRLAPLEPHDLAYDKPLCASLDGFTLHAATRAGASHPGGRADGLVRITLKKAYTVGTVAVDMDPLSLLCRLATSVPPPRFHTVRYAGVLAAGSPWRSRIAPKPPSEEPAAASAEPDRPRPAGGCRPWVQLLARTFAVDVLACPRCHGRMRLLAMLEDPPNVARFLAAMGEPTEVPHRSPGRGPPYWKSRVLRRQVLGDEDDAQAR